MCCVRSGSMETAFQRGDILFLTNYNDPIRVGEIVVFKIKHRDIPIVHRVLEVHEDSYGKIQLLTKGDNNRVDDRGLYAPGQIWLPREDVLGRAKGLAQARSEERRVGKECVSPCRSRGWPNHKKKKQ